MKKILIVEDDEGFLQTLKTALELERYEITAVSDGLIGYEKAAEEDFDLIILDLVLPSMDGYEICKKIRAEGNNTPIIFLSGKKKEEIDKILGFELGGDDYLIKPFGNRELIARIRAIHRRVNAEEKISEKFSFKDIIIDFKELVLSKGDKQYTLTPKEAGLLKYLIIHEGKVITREDILNKVCGYDKFPTTRTIDTFIHSLRHKIEDDPAKPTHIITTPWMGYKFKK